MAGRPLRKRSLGEVQLMHNLGEHKYVQQRQEWLQMKLKSIHTALMRNAEEGESSRTRRLNQEDLTKEEEELLQQ
ncbi:hypothetical protein Z043_114851 [Scleropages formosus]|uniref:Parathyroid hormone n=1 Tax=Scleropages formosus TaxID=113540 RepID=A0A0P7YHG7_SCLFO|nr:hypothetical protein Z043_114851 [Scleropages formosus]